MWNQLQIIFLGIDFHKKLKILFIRYFSKKSVKLSFHLTSFFGPGQHFLISWNFHRLYVIFIHVKLFDYMFMCSQISLQQFKIRFFFVIYHHDSCTTLFEFRPFEVLYVVDDLTTYDNNNKKKNLVFLLLFMALAIAFSDIIYWHILYT